MKKKLNIAFDAKYFFYIMNNNIVKSGVYYVTYNIAYLFVRNKDIQIYFYYDGKYNEKFYFFLKKILDSNNFFMIDSYSLKWLNIDIYYSSFYKIPNFIIKNHYIQRYSVIYDIIPIVLNNFNILYNSSAKGIFYHLNSFNKKDYLFAISEYTAKDFIKYFKNIDINNIYITYLAAKDHLKLKNDNLILTKYNIPTNMKYVFSLCTMEPRKNLVRIIKTFFKFKEKNNINDIILVLGGSYWPSFKNNLLNEIEQYRDEIIITGYIDDEDLAYLYSGAEWFVYTSEYEGFGLPPLEAMACGCPVITSNNSSLPEVVGDSGIMIDWDSDEQHIEAYEKYYFNNSFREEMSKKGLERSKLFSWNKCVNEMIQIIKHNYKYNRFIKYFVTENLIYIKLFIVNLIFINPKCILSFKKIKDYYIIKIFGIKITIKKSSIFNITYLNQYKIISILGIKIRFKTFYSKLNYKIDKVSKNIDKIKCYTSDYNDQLMKINVYKIFNRK